MVSLILLGAPGSGKGTYASRVGAALGIPQISTGDMLRQAIRSGTPLGREVKSYVDGGKLVPDETLKRIVVERLSGEDCASGFILDGYPRTLAQADHLDEILTQRGSNMSLVVSIDATEELLLKRLGGRRSCPKCGGVYNIHTIKPKKEGVCDKGCGPLITRPDDEPDTIRKRFKVYTAQSAPLIERYRGKGLLKTVNSEETPEAVVERILGFVKEARA